MARRVTKNKKRIVYREGAVTEVAAHHNHERIWVSTWMGSVIHYGPVLKPNQAIDIGRWLIDAGEAELARQKKEDQ